MLVIEYFFMLMLYVAAAASFLFMLPLFNLKLKQQSAIYLNPIIESSINKKKKTQNRA